MVAECRFPPVHQSIASIARAVEIVVRMREMGHMIGVGVLDNEQKEVYDAITWSVMALLLPDSCNAEPIRYSGEYWILRNLEYCKIHPPSVA